jgi:multidrug efflux system outer membrane protein
MTSRIKRKARLATVTCACALLFACAPSLKDNPPREAQTKVPDSFGKASSGGDTKVRTTKGRDWSGYFSDPKLRALINTALKNNQELNIQLQEIIIAKNEVRALKGEYQPRLDAGAGVGVEKVGRDTSQGVSDEAHGVPEHLGNFEFGLRASWEIDIWKRLRNSSKAAALRYLSTAWGRNFIVTEIVAEIARSYYELVALDNQLEVLEKNIALQKNALEIMRLQKEAGRVTELAVQRFEAEVLKNSSREFELKQEQTRTENRINFLLGRYPAPIARTEKKLRDIEPRILEAGVPSDLLENRPDLRQAELELEASKLDVKVARARFYPALSVEAGVGYQTYNAGHLFFTPESLAYNAAGNLTAPLLNRAGIKAAYRSANARQLKAVYNYERALVRAFSDVANELSAVKNYERSFEFETKQVENLVSAIEVSSVLFQSARADYMEVLLTRRDSLEAEMDLIDTRLRQLKATVDLYQALGGGWK